MSQAIDALIADLVAWVSVEARPYADVMEAWRTSCPRLTVWEDAVDRGFVVAEAAPDHKLMVRATSRGRDWIAARQS
jgi:hypothetical protein